MPAQSPVPDAAPRRNDRRPSSGRRITNKVPSSLYLASWICLASGVALGVPATVARAEDAAGGAGASSASRKNGSAFLDDIGYISFTQKYETYNGGKSTDRIYIGDTSGARNLWTPDVSVNGNKGLIYTCHYPLEGGSYYLEDTYATRTVPPSSGPYPACELYVDNDTFDADDLRAVLYYGYGGPGYDRSIWPEKDFFENPNYSPVPDKRLYAYTAMLVSYVYTGDWNHFNVYNGGRFYNWATEQFKNGALPKILAKKDKVPDDFQAFLLETEGSEQKYMQYVGYLSPQRVYVDAAAADGTPVTGAAFGVYSDSDCNSEVCRLTPDEDMKGRYKSAALGTGTYYVKEISAPDGYEADAKSYTVKTGQPGVSHLELANKSTKARISEVARLADVETGLEKPVGAASLAGAEFEISYWEGEKNVSATSRRAADRTWKVASDEAGIARLTASGLLAGSSELPATEDGTAFLPAGVISVRMTKAPKGYQATDAVRTALIAQTDDGCSSQLSTTGDARFSLHPIREDKEFTLVDADGKPRAGVPFLLTSKTTGEAHVLVSGADGKVSTAANNGKDVNANDAAYADGVVDPSKLKQDAGIWFSGSKDSSAKPDADATGALPYDSYTLKELPLAGSDGKALSSLTWDLTDSSAGESADPATVRYMSQRIQAQMSAQGAHMAPAASATRLQTQVSYEGLEIGKEYLAEATLHMLNDDGSDAGPLANISPASATITPTSSDGSCALAFNIDATGHAGKTLVCFVTLKQDGQALCALDSLNDENRSVRITGLRAKASDGMDGDREIAEGFDSRIAGSIEYANLIPGKAYELVTSAHIRDEAGLDAGVVTTATGEDALIRKALKPNTPSGSVDVEIPVSVDDLAGQDLVLCSQLLCDGQVVARAEDFSDDDAALHVAASVTPLPTGVDGVGPLAQKVLASAGLLAAAGGTTVAGSGIIRRFFPFRRRR